VTTDLGSYRQHLVAALRVSNVPSARIGEAVAEVESHVADTGEDPVEAFGEPAEYARRLSESLGPAGRSGRWTNFVVAVVAFAASGVATTSLLNGDRIAAAVAVLALVVLCGWLYRRRGVDRIVDPRTGATLRMPVPRWVFAVLAVAVAGLVVVGLLL
jgi:hypothetical protein